MAEREFSKTYATKALAEGRRTELLAAQRRGEAFDRESGVPESELRAQRASVTWYENAVKFMDTVWAGLEPGSRRKLAEALATVTLVMVEPGIDPVDHAFCFRWLVSWAFNSRERLAGLPRDEEAAFAMTWIADHSLPVAALADPKVARRAHNSTTTDSFGKPYAVNTYRNKRKGLSGTINFAIEMGRLDTNPLERISTDQSPSVPRLVAFFALLYFAALRSAEALALRLTDCVLPERGWGELCFAEFKHRAPGQSRTVPTCPELVAYLREHVEQFGAAPDGRLFHRADGGAIRHSTYAKIWSRARDSALTPEQFASPLARRPYDLRHAGVSTWLNAGVPATQVAEWAGHSVEVLLSTYAKCLDGPDQAVLAQRRIDALLGMTTESGNSDASVEENGAGKGRDFGPRMGRERRSSMIEKETRRDKPGEGRSH